MISKYNLIFTPLLFALPLYAALCLASEEHVVDQKNKQFDVEVLMAKKGDSVRFLNSDRFHHNIYSISETQAFDLGSYPKGQSRTIKLDKPGTIEVRCAIHPKMKMRIEVSE